MLWSIVFIFGAISLTVLYLTLSGNLEFFQDSDELAQKHNLYSGSLSQKNQDLLCFVFMLFGSNVFMAAAWYAHLEFMHMSIPAVILISWGIALPEYMLHVPANRIGHAYFDGAQLKTVQTIMTLTGFAVFMGIYFGEGLNFQQFIGFAVLIAGTFLIFSGKSKVVG